MSVVHVGRGAWRLGLVVLLALAVIMGAGSTKRAYAATTITVNTTSDEAVTDGKCSLREAIANANANTDTTGGDCVAGSPGTDTINLSGLSGTITLGSNLPVINHDVTINGPGASTLTINANGNLNVFRLFATQAAISGVTLTGATAGAIFNSATTILSDDSVSGNDNTDFTGRVGGIINFGTLTIRNSAVNGNSGISSGGILNNGTLVVINSTMSGNSGRQGGAISNNNVLTVESSTISGNTAGAGGGLDSGNNATIRNSTIANNTATSIGGGIYGGGLIENTTIAGNRVGPVGFAPGIFTGGNITLVNSIVADQTGGPNCIGVGPASDGGYNVDGGASCNFSAVNHSLSSTNPLLDPAGLKNNGGPTQTIALLPGSPAINAIPFGVNGCGTTITSDQRGVSRPQGSGCDIGAFELVATAIDQPITATGANISAAEGKAFSGTVATFNDPDPSSTSAEYAATIDWGDGSSTSAGVISRPIGGPFKVTGSHTYAEEGSSNVTVTITDIDNPSNTATANSTAKVADAALTASPACAPTSTQSYDGPTASFTDAASPNGTLSDFTATINWGDGSSSGGTITGPNGGQYTVSASHTYASTGQFTITNTIIDVGGSKATATCQILAFAFAPGGGSFVIGDKNSALGTSVEFWGAEWAKLNSLSRGLAPNSFKGFAESPSTPACVSSWSADPATSTPPPPGPLPAYMAVIVTSNATKSGSTISGNAPQIVVVKTNPGYAPDPGHAGTGTVVALVC